MRERFRERYTAYVQYGLDSPVPGYEQFSRFPVPFEYISDSERGPGPCIHWKCFKSVTGEVGRGPGVRTYRLHYPSGINVGLITAECNTLANIMLTRDLRGSGFEIIPFIAELDETLAMFSLKFLRDLSYGAVTWGIMPFISDLRKLLLSLKRIFSSVRTSPSTEVNRTRRLDRVVPLATDPSEPLAYNLNGIVRVKGKRFFTLPEVDKRLDKALFLLDELGVHPDLKTIWDLVPFSFVVDYFLPIGEILESLHPRGWYLSNLQFEGWYSFNGLWESAESFVHAGEQWNNPLYSSYSVFIRERVFNPSPSFQLKWKSPSLKEIFNTTYLFTVLKNVF